MSVQPSIDFGHARYDAAFRRGGVYAVAADPWERVEIIGRNAFLVVDDQIETTLFDDETGPANSWRPAVPMFDETFGGCSGLLNNVLDAVRGLVPLDASGADGAAAGSLSETIRRSLDKGAEIDIASEGLAP